MTGVRKENDDLLLFSEDLKGNDYFVDRDEVKAESFVSKLSRHGIIDLKKAGLLQPAGVGAATIVPERGPKPGNTIYFEEQPTNSFKAISQIRYDIEYEYEDAWREAILSHFLEWSNLSLARAIDNAVLHGTQPSNGQTLINVPGFSIERYLTQNAQTQPLAGDSPLDVAQGLWQAHGSVRQTGHGSVNGILFDSDSYYNLPQFGPESVGEYLPGFANENAFFRNTPVYITERVAHDYDSEAKNTAGNETGIVAFAGDWDNLIIGIDVLSYGTWTSGNPDGAEGPDGGYGGLEHLNQALIRVEYKVDYIITRPETFVKVVSAEETPEA